MQAQRGYCKGYRVKSTPIETRFNLLEAKEYGLTTGIIIANSSIALLNINTQTLYTKSR